MPTNGTIVLVRRLIPRRQVLVRAVRVVVMQVASSINMDVRTVRDMCVRMPPTGEHRLRDHRGSEQDRKEGVTAHTLNTLTDIRRIVKVKRDMSLPLMVGFMPVNDLQRAAERQAASIASFPDDHIKISLVLLAQRRQ